MKAVRQGIESLDPSSTNGFEFKNTSDSVNPNRLFMAAINNSKKKSSPICLDQALRQITDETTKVLRSYSANHIGLNRVSVLLCKHIRQLSEQLDSKIAEFGSQELVLRVIQVLWQNELYQMAFSVLSGQKKTLALRQATYLMDGLTFTLLIGCADNKYGYDECAQHLATTLKYLTNRMGNRTIDDVVQVSSLVAARLYQHKLFILLKYYTEKVCSNHKDLFQSPRCERSDDANPKTIITAKVF
jgi:hypothetical protein